MGDAACYVYAVVGREVSVGDAGVAGAPVTTVASDGLAAVVSPVGEGRVRASRAALSAHERVVEAAASTTTTVPLQFGVVLPSRAAVVDDLLQARRFQLAHLLGVLDGKAEYRLEATFDEQRAIRVALDGDPRLRRLVERRKASPAYGDRIAVGEAVAGAVGRVTGAWAEAVLDHLRPHADASAVLPTRRPEMALRAAFLVEQAARAGFDAAVDEVAAQLAGHLALHLVGPLAPWDFVGGAVAGDGR
ncbi:MAG TPA: GvpL/GvpF family gas vesicle protein [Acidimicrobiales bacterium]|nr:GvpL/GvpF family gas vesicle protein [Acidimicrobiales bacterium]